MANRCPPNQTVVLKWLSDDTSTRLVERFVKAVTPDVISIFFTQDRALLLEGYKQIAYLNYSSVAVAESAKRKLDEALVLAKKQNAPFDCTQVVTFMKDKGFQPEAKHLSSVFPVWIGNIMEEDETELERIFKKFGPLCAPPNYIPLRLFPGSNRSAIVNFTTYKSAIAAIEACQKRQLIFGGGMIGVAQARDNTKFVMDLEDVLIEYPSACMKFSEVQKFADSAGTKAPWLDIVSCCRDIFDIDQRNMTVSLKSSAGSAHTLNVLSGGRSEGDGKQTTFNHRIGKDLPSDPQPHSSSRLDSAPFRAAVEQGKPAGRISDVVASSQPLKAAEQQARVQACIAEATSKEVGSSSAGPGMPAPAFSAPLPPSAPATGDTGPAGGAEAGAKDVEQWRVDDVCALMARCGFEAAVGTVRANGIDGKTLLDLLQDEEGRKLLTLPMEEGGVGLKPIQLRRVQLEVKKASESPPAAAAAETVPVAPRPETAAAQSAAPMDRAGPAQATDRAAAAAPAAAAHASQRAQPASIGMGAAVGGSGAGVAGGAMRWGVVKERQQMLESEPLPAAQASLSDYYETTLCPISLEVMTDPVLASDGHTYDRASIEAWFRRDGVTSPCTGLPLPSEHLIPNHAVRGIISRLHPAVRLRPVAPQPEGRRR